MCKRERGEDARLKNPMKIKEIIRRDFRPPHVCGPGGGVLAWLVNSQRPASSTTVPSYPPCIEEAILESWTAGCEIVCTNAHVFEFDKSLVALLTRFIYGQDRWQKPGT